MDWTLSTCCNTEQIIFISLTAGYSLIIFFLWDVFIIKPFKMFAVLLHELGHATAAILTGGKVISIKVEGDEGGLTTYRGGINLIVLPAGYLGSSLWGLFFIITSTDDTSVQVGAAITIFGLLTVLVLADNWTLRGLTIAFLALIVLMWVVEFYTPFHGLQYSMLFIGVMNALYSIYDIYDDLIARRLNSSDASKCAELTNISSPVWGVIWGILAVFFLVIGVYLGLVIEGSG